MSKLDRLKLVEWVGAGGEWGDLKVIPSHAWRVANICKSK